MSSLVSMQKLRIENKIVTELFEILPTHNAYRYLPNATKRYGGI